LTRTLTTGVVSAVQRQIFAPNGVPIDSAIQTDAAINHGNSGGPLIDAAGRVIGVTSQIQTGGDQNQGNVGIGFAIPVNTVRDIAGQIISTGKAQHAFLGVSAAAVTPQLKKLFNLPTASGLLVRDVTKGSAAAKAGIKGGTTSVVVDGESYRIGGDLITKVDGRPVATYDQLYSAIQRKSPGDTMKIELYRDDSKRTVTAKLGTRAGP
jgi:S1-C subfamily serine protease